jgi:hypothetical protein
MNARKVFVAMLRQPYRENPNEMRTDPFWEFGSFGLTGCHKTNLMHPKRIHELSGARIAFVQGGQHGSKLVCLTPPIQIFPYSDRSQIKWAAETKPLRYNVAPLVIGVDGSSDIPEVLHIIEDVRRNGWMGKFASKFRTRRQALPIDCAKQITDVWARAVASAKPEHFADVYTDALPYLPPKVDANRLATYEKLLSAVA